MTRKERAFTLIELIVVLTVAAVTLAVAAPPLADTIRRNRTTTDINRLVGSLHTARNVAISRQDRVVVCPGRPSTGCRGDGRWEAGWLVFRDPARRDDCRDADGDSRCDTGPGRLLRAVEPLDDDQLTLTGSGNLRRRVAYKPTGFADGYAGTFRLCDSSGRVEPRGITLSLSGRIRPRESDTLTCP